MEPMKQHETGTFMTTADRLNLPDAVRIVNWNINRGQRLNEVIEFLAGAGADLILLQEADWNAARTLCRNVAQEIARALEMNYVFGCEFEELAQGRDGMPAYHGQATLSRFPLSHSRILRFRCQSRFWLPRWYIPRVKPFQRRIGGRMALISHIALPQQMLVVYNAHLESRGDEGLRWSQLGELLDDASQHAANFQVVVGGDFNADLRHPHPDSVISKTEFINSFAGIANPLTTVPTRFNGSRAIDWILTKGPLTACEPKLHESILASDHYPLSLTLRRA
jgi:endonuclease/exonuclease/phosphatase family metal-dependent hydrolase